MTKQSLQSTDMADRSMSEVDQALAELFLDLAPKVVGLITQAQKNPGKLKDEERQSAFDMLSELLFARQMAADLAREGAITAVDVKNIKQDLRQQEAADTAAGINPQEANKNLLRRLVDYLRKRVQSVKKLIVDGPSKKPRPDQLRPAKQSTNATPTPASA